MGKQGSYLQIFLSTRKIKKFGKVLTSGKICSGVDSEVYFHHFENRFLNVSVRILSEYYSRSHFCFNKTISSSFNKIVYLPKE